MDFGQTLRTARESKGYSVKQLAELTRMAPRTINELEAEDFSHIAAAIYGRGFVKLYCEAVGLESKPLLDEFMEIYSGNRTTEIRERAVAPTEETVPPPDAAVPPVSASIPEPAVPFAPDPQPELFTEDEESESSAPVLQKEPPESSLSRYATPVRTSGSSFTLSPALWRMGVLALAALILLVLVVLGLKALFRASDQTPSAKTAPATSHRSAPRTPQKIPSLFIN